MANSFVVLPLLLFAHSFLFLLYVLPLLALLYSRYYLDSRLEHLKFELLQLARDGFFKHRQLLMLIVKHPQ